MSDAAQTEIQVEESSTIDEQPQEVVAEVDARKAAPDVLLSNEGAKEPVLVLVSISVAADRKCLPPASAVRCWYDLEDE
ncbi:hypothetical protein CPC08DRAFT_769563 [Agrocybe pediades]|nr:hypothetical protein CPC08DRAFT_769563 [Agrocybe pediades]